MHPVTRRAGALAALMTVVLLAPALSGCGERNLASPADVIEKPVRAHTEAGDRVFVLTSQWRTIMRLWRGSASPARQDLLIDVWAFDAASGKPVWRHRLETLKHGVNMGRRLVGADGGVLWTAGPSGLVGLSLKDGSVVADNARIEAANAPLKGLMPKEERYLTFDAGGLRVRAADGREWRIDGATLAASAAGPPPERLADGKAAPAPISGGVGTSAFLSQGLPIGGRWLGLMSEAGVAKAQAQGVGDGLDWQTSARQRLWMGRVGGENRLLYHPLSDLKPLPQSPEFLNAGLLNNGNLAGQAIMLFKPDSVLVLHADRLGEGGRMRLTRVSGPLGKAEWTVDLPMERLDAVMAGPASLVLMGSRGEASPDRDDKTDVDQLTFIDLASGRSVSYGFNVPATDEANIPPSSTPAAQ